MVSGEPGGVSPGTRIPGEYGESGGSRTPARGIDNRFGRTSILGEVDRNQSHIEITAIFFIPTSLRSVGASQGTASDSQDSRNDWDHGRCPRQVAGEYSDSEDHQCGPCNPPRNPVRSAQRDRAQHRPSQGPTLVEVIDPPDQVLRFLFGRDLLSLPRGRGSGRAGRSDLTWREGYEQQRGTMAADNQLRGQRGLKQSQRAATLATGNRTDLHQNGPAY